MRFAFWVLLAGSLFALEPAQVLVVVNADNPQSVSVGSYYLRCRDLPQQNIVPLRLGRGAQRVISHENYIQKVALPLQKRLSGDRYHDIRCLLTTFNMPYIIAAPVPGEMERHLIDSLQNIADDKSEILEKAVEQLKDSSGISLLGGIDDKLSSASKILGEVILAIKATEDEKLRQDKIERFIGIVFPLYGAFAVQQLAAIEFGIVFDPSQIDMIEAQISRDIVDDAVKEGWSYEQCIANDYYNDFANVYGVLELLRLLDDSIKKLQGVDMDSALDSELALVKSAGYDFYKWQHNGLRENLHESSVLMVSRIDGPSERICRRIIDDSMTAEKQGLAGVVCLDARYEKEGSDLYGQYDLSLKRTADIFREQTGFEVTLDEKPDIYTSRPPLQTAFYCGWYSLGTYVDAFDFSPGAVGYHIASLEAVDIRDPLSGQWVASMLDDRIAATLGAVREPYLRAFPKPDEFFTCLIDGYTVAEAFAKTNPYNSWQMLLIADPLYRPFKP